MAAMTIADELGTADAANVLGMTDRQVRNLVKGGLLKPDRIKKTSERRTFYYFSAETVEAYKRQRSGEASDVA
jgi:hypothetical protein